MVKRHFKDKKHDVKDFFSAIIRPVSGRILSSVFSYGLRILVRT